MYGNLEKQQMIQAAFAKRYPLQTDGDLVMRERGPELCRKFLLRGLGDKNAESRLCDPSDATFWQQLSEVIVADQLNQVGLVPSHTNVGPDLLIDHEQRRIWVEIICPTPVGIPEDWLKPPDVPVYCGAVPHEALLLRWTSAIKEKAEKLIGTTANPEKGYLSKGFVGSDDAYVIAINGRLLRAGSPRLEGISQWPFAVEATFSVGPFAINFNRETLDVVSRGHQHRPILPKPNGASVPADTFLDPRFAHISAIWAMDFDEIIILGRKQPMAVIHNPQARNPLPPNLLPAIFEYIAVREGDHYNLKRHLGSLTTRELR